MEQNVERLPKDETDDEVEVVGSIDEVEVVDGTIVAVMTCVVHISTRVPEVETDQRAEVLVVAGVVVGCKIVAVMTVVVQVVV